jgi:hypothetical protein
VGSAARRHEGYLGFETKPVHGAKHQFQLGWRPDPEGAAWFIAFAVKQLALITENGFHEISFRLRVKKMAEGVGNAPTSANADPVFETGAASLYLPAFRRLVN